MDTQPWRRRAVGYLAFQSIAGLAWWIAIVASDAVRDAFELDPGDHVVLDAFFAADLAVFIAGGLTAALAVARGWASAPTIAGFVAGGVVYAFLYLGWCAIATGRSWLGVPAMGAAAAATSLIAWRARRLVA